MKILATVLTAFMVMNAQAATEKPAYTPAPNPHVHLSGDALVVRDAILTEQLVNEALSLLDANPSIERLWLIDVPGGIGVSGARLAWRAQEMDVFVAGGCYSACADVALSGRTLNAVPWKGKLMSALIIHGAFTLHGEWLTRSANNLTRYAERLEPISRKDIDIAVSFPYPTGAGLFIFTDGSVRAAQGETVLLCEYFPSRCRPIEVSLKQIRISTSELPVPAALAPVFNSD